jgi:Tol biopolymer transport system component
MHPSAIRPWLAAAVVLGVAAGATVATTAAGAAESVVRVSVSSAGVEANGYTGRAVLSGDGRHVAFMSAAGNLAVNDTDTRPDVYLRDTLTGTTELVSVGVEGAAVGGELEDVSADGHVVVFTSSSPDVVPNDFNGVQDVFVRNVLTGATERVSVADDESQAAQGSRDASVSRDGRYVAFASLAPLAAQDRSFSGKDVYVRDLVAGTTELVSISRKGTDGGGQQPSISDGGRFVTFTSKGKGLVKGDTNGTHDVFVRDLLKDRTERVSVSSKGEQGSKPSAGSEIAGAGRYVVFTSVAGNLVKKDTNKKQDVFVHDRWTDRTELASVDNGERQAGGPARSATISADGRYVLFSAAPDLRKGGSGTTSLYLRDRVAGGTTTPVTKVLTGAVLSGDGRAIAFVSSRSDLVDGDTNNYLDAFLYRR